MGAGGTYPALKLEFAPGVAASDVPSGVDWVDISDRLLLHSVKWGTEDEFSQPGAGTMQLQLDNSDGELDPDNSSGGWYGDLLPLMWFRLTGGTTSANTDVFYGQVSIDGFRLSASQFSGAVDVTVEIRDGLEQLANTDAPSSVYELEVKADSPKVWYRLGESAGTVAVDSSGNGHHGAYVGGATFGSVTGLIENDGDGAISFNESGYAIVAPTSAAVMALPITIEAWFQVEAGQGRIIWQQGSNDTEDKVTLEVIGNSGYTNIFFQHVTPTGRRTWASTGSYTDGEIHHVVVTYTTPGTAPTLFVDDNADSWTLPFGASGTVSTWTPSEQVHIGNSFALSYAYDGIIDEVAIYEADLGSTRTQAHYDAGTNPWGNELTSARTTHILDAVGWPSTLRSISTGKTTMPSAELNGTDALALLQETATAEGGRIYVDHRNGGEVQFEDRHYRSTTSRSNTSQATFGDGGGTEVPYSSIELQDDQIINSASLQRFGGSTVTFADATSQATYQERDFSLSGLLTTSDTEVAARAEAIVAEKKDRHRRVRSMVLEPRGDSHPAWAQVFARKVGDMVTVKWRPPYGGTYTFRCWIDGIGHDWDQREARWRTTFWLSPVPFDTEGTAYWVWNTSTWDSGTNVARWGW